MHVPLPSWFNLIGLMNGITDGLSQNRGGATGAAPFAFWISAYEKCFRAFRVSSEMIGSNFGCFMFAMIHFYIN